MPERDANFQKELEQYSAALQSSEARFSNIIARSADGIIIVDAGGTIRFVNPAAESLFGRKADELTGQVFGFPVVAGETSELTIVSRKEEWAIIEMRVVETEWEEERAFLANLRDITGQKKTLEALRESEERYSALVHASSQALYRMNPDWSEMLRLQGGRFIPDTEKPNRNWLQQYIYPDDRKMLLEIIDRAVRAGTVFELEHRVRRADGTVGWTSSRAVPVRNADGQIVEWFGAVSDITERKRAEEERERLLTQFDAVLQSITEGVVIADLEGNILTMNPSALAFHEYATVEQVRQQLHQLLDTFELSDLEGRSVPFEQWPLSRVLRGERFTDFEVRVRRKDTGTTRIGSYSGTPVQTRSGDVILAVITVRDITERKRAEAEIERLASFPLINPNPVLELNADGQMTFCNPAAKEILEKEGDVTVINPLLPQDMPEILQSLRNNKPGQFLRSIEINGRFFEELVYIALQFQAVRIYTMDITRRKRAEEQIEILNAKLAARAAELEAANRELETFNYTVAHDLRKPLTVVNGYCQAIKELCSNKLDEQCKGYLQEAYDGTLRMNRLIDALLNFSCLAHAELHRESVDLSSLANEVAAELQLSEPERRVTFRIVEGAVVNGDANLLRVVLDNLLGNAWKYTGMREEAVIEFGVTESDGKPAWFVRDNGAGFAMADTEKLFVPFQRLPGAEEFKGFGIGLATVARIIERHGGRLWAEGEPDKGAIFFFSL